MDRKVSLQPAGLLRIVWRLSRPPIWMVSILPVAIGHMLATRELVPRLSDGQFPVAITVMGPLLWGATLAINDAYDLAGDRLNPRKAHAPLVLGLATPTFARRVAYGFAVAALAGAATINVTFLILVAAFLGLAWAYSVPPVRLKERPGADVAVNAVGVGAIALLAGWAITRPLGAFPWIILPQGLLVATAVYVPSTLVDEAADRASSILTLATAIGRARAYRIGWSAWTASCVGAVALAAADVVVPRRMLLVFIAALPLLLWEYHALIGRARDERAMTRGIIVSSSTFAAVNLVFALMYTGVWG